MLYRLTTIRDLTTTRSVYRSLHPIRQRGTITTKDLYFIFHLQQQRLELDGRHETFNIGMIFSSIDMTVKVQRARARMYCVARSTELNSIMIIYRSS